MKNVSDSEKFLCTKTKNYIKIIEELIQESLIKMNFLKLFSLPTYSIISCNKLDYYTRSVKYVKMC